MIQPNFNFCQICKISYEDYHLHIKEKQHLKTSSQTLGDKYIKDTCKSLLKKEKKIVKLEKEMKSK